MYLDSDEWYPVLTLREEPYGFLTDYAVEITPELKTRYDKVMQEFEELQQELDKLPTTKIPPTEKGW